MMLELKNISCSYGRVRALDDISISVEEGSIVSILGSNGAGKSTCLKVISRIVKNQSGSIILRDEDITSMAPEKVVSRGVIHVPEGRMIFPDLTVTENLKMGAYIRKDKAAIRTDLDRVFSLFRVLKDRRKQVASTLSGGEQQMLAIGRGLMGSPQVLLLDEPSLGLAPILVEELFEVIQDINKEGTTILLVEQNAYMGLQVSGYAYVFESGVISIHGSSKELLKNDEVKNSYLGIVTGS
jgi:branched-chain amino acid transport system ATP-binding protein